MVFWMDISQKHLTIKVIGRVQGVFFRTETRALAEKLGISGFVRNEPDGSVYIEAEGDEESLEKFLSWVSKGPELVKVENLDVQEGEVAGYVDFKIQY